MSDSAPFAAIFAVLAPGGALLALLVLAAVSRLRPLRRFVVPAGAGLGFLGILFSPMEPSWAILLSRWQPLRLLGNFPALAPDRLVWPLALALGGAVLGAALVQMGRPPRYPSLLGFAALGMLSFGLLALWGENLLTLLLAWASFDLAWGTGMVAFGLPLSQTRWRMGGGVFATLLLWTSSLLLEQGGTGYVWSLMVSPPSGSEALLFLAALIRLGTYPFYPALPLEDRRRHPLGAVLLLEPVLAWALLVRMFGQARFPVPAWPWLEGLAAGTFLAGGLLALTAPDEARCAHWAGLSAIGGILWAGLRATSAPQAAATWLMGGALWTLGISLLYLGRGWDRSSPWWMGGTGVGALALAITPLLGGAGAPLAGGFRWAGFFLGQALLTVALLRDALRPPASEEPVDFWLDIARAAGHGVLIALMVVGALGMPRWIGPILPEGRSHALEWPTMAIWVLSTLAGGVLYFQALPRLREKRTWMAPVHALLKLDWAYDLLAGALSRGTGVISMVADVTEGAGAVLWALAVFLLILVILLGL